MGIWPFSTIKHLRERNVELNARNRSLTGSLDTANATRNEALRTIKERDGQVDELTRQVQESIRRRKHTRDGIAAYIDCAKSGVSWSGRIVVRGDGPVKDRTLVLQPLAGRVKRTVEQVKGWQRRLLRTFDVEPKGVPCEVERRSGDGKINVTVETL